MSSDSSVQEHTRCLKQMLLLLETCFRGGGAGEERNENLPSILGASNPFIPFSIINPLILLPSEVSLAHTTKTSAMGELVIQFLAPVNS